MRAGLGVGDVLAVRVTRAAQGGKGPRLQAAPDPPGNGPPALLHPGTNPVLRLAALHAGPILVDDPRRRRQPARRTRRPRPRRPRLGRLPGRRRRSAGRAHRGRCQARLAGCHRAHRRPGIAIDVDTAAATAARQAKPALQEAANRAALPALCRQIRLRNLSGAILIDLAGLSSRRRIALAAPLLRDALAADPLGPKLLGFTAGGLAEIHRPRIHPPLHELLAGPHAAGLAALRRVAA